MIATQSQGGDLKITSSLVDSKGNPLSPANLVLPRGNGKGSLNATLYWPEICIFPENQPLKFQTIVESNVCGELKYDTLFTFLRIVPKQLTIFINSNFSGDSKIVLNEEESVSFTLKGDIVDQRPIQLFASGPLKDQPGYSFSGGEGNGTVSDEFLFETTCGGKSGTYPIKFKVTSLFCEALYQDSISYDVNLEFEPDTLGTIPNLLTVNGDTKNDYFSLDGISAKETCANQFEFIEIYNRWGKRIFFSKDRNFKWVPDENSEGIFWFGLNFKNKRISSWLMLVH
jgi:gliding motility-associated-like protein